MFIEYIEAEQLSENAKKYLHAMKSSITMLLYLVSDILDMKAFKEETFFSHMDTFNLRNAIYRVLSITELQV